MGKELRVLPRRPAKWLIALLAVILVGTYLFTLPSCRTDRVVVVDMARGETLIKMTTVSDTLGGQRMDVIWEGVGGAGSPIEIPFVSPGEGYFQIEVQHEGREEPIVHEFGYLTPHWFKVYYVVVGNEEILDFSESFRGFDTPAGKGSDFSLVFQIARYLIGDALTCLDGR